MESKFIIFVVLATVTQSSLAGLLDLGGILGAITGTNTDAKNDNGHSSTEKSSGNPYTVKPNNPNHTVPDCSRIREAFDRASCVAQESTALTYDVIETKIIQAGNRSGNKCKHGSSLTGIATVKEYNLLKVYLGLCFSAIRIAQPGASSTVQKVQGAAESILRKAVTYVNAGIDLIGKGNCTDIATEFEKIKKEAISAGVNLIDTIYIPIFNGLDSSCKMGAKILSARKESESLVTKALGDVFCGTECGLTKACPDINLACHSSFETLRKNALTSIKIQIYSIFRTLFNICEASSESPTDTYGDY